MRTVLVTGGSSGIGKAIVERFARGGDEVWFTYNRGRERADQILSELADCRIVAHPLDLASRSSRAQLLPKLPERIDVLINNAGLGSKTIEQMSADPEEQDELMMRVNALGPLWLTQALLPRMKAQRSAKIIFMSSVGGGIAQFPGFRYSDEMSKAAVAHLGKQLAMESSYERIDTFIVCPGATNTPMFQASTLRKLSAAAQKEFCEKLPGRRLIESTEIAELCHFLCQDSSRVLRGAILDASLGLGTYPGAMIDIE
jgi:NAD(P)-dependent dehydrogenase (short-subunit alcohol dehydrogenase family)